ncbi:hypothetical protein [Paenibacillus lautus]|uniref:hypothetical protein n=1 Tax=Paenibacillus lautus TaxID=1401 RepID=UPI001BCE6F52|nr:hypothetical protein [Paenibacillus lautus]
MAWLESHQSLGRHIKTKRLSRKLGITVPATIGHLHLLWWWAMDNLPDGCISLLEPEDIADEMMWTGDADELLSALIDVGFIDEIDEELFIHDWHDYIGKLVDKRRTDAERKRKSRKTTKRSPEDVQRTSNGQSEADPRDGAGNSTVQYSTVPKEDITTDKFARIEKAYATIHKTMGLKPVDWPIVNKLLEKGVTADLIIEVMEEKHAKKIQEGGTVNGFSFYTNAINERFNQGQRNEGRLDFLNDL